ncbi:MAG: DNA-binding protein [Prevotella sp.]|nr:DNA-binding protein [Prevotella sp.]
MSQKFIKMKNKNMRSTAFGKWFAKGIYDKNFVSTKQLAEFIQSQASVKRSDIVAVLDELGSAMKHFFEMGQKVKLEGIGIFKVGFSSVGVEKAEDVGAQNITTRRVLFTPETVRVVTGQTRRADGTIRQKFAIAKALVKDVVFEETHENSVSTESANTQEGGE